MEELVAAGEAPDTNGRTTSGTNTHESVDTAYSENVVELMQKVLDEPGVPHAEAEGDDDTSKIRGQTQLELAITTTVAAPGLDDTPEVCTQRDILVIPHTRKTTAVRRDTFGTRETSVSLECHPAVSQENADLLSVTESESTEELGLKSSALPSKGITRRIRKSKLRKWVQRWYNRTKTLGEKMMDIQPNTNKANSQKLTSTIPDSTEPAKVKKRGSRRRVPNPTRKKGLLPASIKKRKNFAKLFS